MRFAMRSKWQQHSRNVVNKPRYPSELMRAYFNKNRLCFLPNKNYTVFHLFLRLTRGLGMQEPWAVFIHELCECSHNGIRGLPFTYEERSSRFSSDTITTTRWCSMQEAGHNISFRLPRSDVFKISWISRVFPSWHLRLCLLNVWHPFFILRYLYYVCYVKKSWSHPLVGSESSRDSLAVFSHELTLTLSRGFTMGQGG